MRVQDVNNRAEQRRFQNRYGRGAVQPVVLIAMALLTFAGFARATEPLGTTIEDFFQPGTQPDTSGGKNFDPIWHSQGCVFCHELDAPVEVPIVGRWAGSMMANSARDPLFKAAMTVANNDAPGSGEMCLRCHAPGGWLAGRSTPPDGSALIEEDLDGVTCTVCHRMVDPVYKPDTSPRQDQVILAELLKAGLLPDDVGGGTFVIDPDDVRRGPLDDVPRNRHGVPIVYSPFHKTSELCGTCHDVSNPALIRQPDGTYTLDPLGAPHSTGAKTDMFPVERTYSEWANSLYATVGVYHGDTYSQDHPTGIMRTCQDCHMPQMDTFASVFQEDPFFQRPDVPAHDFVGGNAWMPSVIHQFYPEAQPQVYIDATIDRARQMLVNASTLELSNDSCSITARITNQTGHKLPTGYGEGRRMWITVQFRGVEPQPIVIRGEYDFESADLTEADTKVYESKHGIDANLAMLLGKKPGSSFHFVLNNVINKDNRIPPRGFTNAAFAAAQCEPVGANYADEQYWDDTRFRVPPGATSAVVTVYYQTSSKEYITFLRDQLAGTGSDAGQDMYEAWEKNDRSRPVLMQQATIHHLTSAMFGDADCDTDVDLADFAALGACVTGEGQRLQLGCEALDENLDGDADLRDFAAFQNAFTGG